MKMIEKFVGITVCILRGGRGVSDFSPANSMQISHWVIYCQLYLLDTFHLYSEFNTITENKLLLKTRFFMIRGQGELEIIILLYQLKFIYTRQYWSEILDILVNNCSFHWEDVSLFVYPGQEPIPWPRLVSDGDRVEGEAGLSVQRVQRVGLVDHHTWGEERWEERLSVVIVTSLCAGLAHRIVLAVVVGERLLPAHLPLLAGVRVPAEPHLLLLLLAVVLHVLPQAARVSVLLLAAEDLTLVRFLQR